MLEKEVERKLNREAKARGGLSLKFVSPGMSGIKNSFCLYYRNCGLPSIKEFWYDESCSKALARVT